MILESILARAQARRGAWLLDECIPGWATTIADDVFDMADPTRCVLGQVFGDYNNGLRDLGLGLDNNDQSVYGFDLDDDHYTDADDNFSELQKAWFSEIEKRRDNPTPNPVAEPEARKRFDQLGG